MTSLKQITYEAGRSALADQESVVAGIRQRTGTLLAAQSLVASFLGAAAIKAHGMHGWTWLAIGALVVGLVLAAIVLSPRLEIGPIGAPGETRRPKLSGCDGHSTGGESPAAGRIVACSIWLSALPRVPRMNGTADIALNADPQPEAASCVELAQRGLPLVAVHDAHAPLDGVRVPIAR